LIPDPFERADTDANNYQRWWIQHAFILVPAQDIVAKFAKTFKDYPIRQKPASFNLEEVKRTLDTNISGR